MQRRSFFNNKILSYLNFCAILIGIVIPHFAIANSNSDISTPESALPAITYLTFEQAAKLALEQNSDLNSLRYQEEALKFRAVQALAPNNPVVGVAKNDITNLSPGADAAVQVYNLNYTLGFPGKSLSQSASIRNQGESMREQAVAKEINILTALSNTYVALGIADVFYKLLRDEEKRNGELEKLLEKKYTTSQAAKVDLLNQKVVIAKLKQDLLANRDAYQLLITQFRQLIRRPEDQSFFPKYSEVVANPELKYEFNDLKQMMFENRPQLKAAEKNVASFRASQVNANLQYFPDFQFSAAMNIYNQQSAAPIPGIFRDYSLGIGIAIPLFFPVNEMNGARAAKRDVMVAEAHHESEKLGAVSDLQTVFTTFSAAKRELENMEKLVVPAAKASYDLMLLTYSLGRADYFRLNEARKTWIDAEKDLIIKKQNSAQLFNQLVSQVGCDFTNKEGPHACNK